MRVPISWLEEYVSKVPEIDELAEGLTNLGLKVDAIHRPKGVVANVVVGEALGIRPHPKADKLILVDVSTGGETFTVVCGAHNFAAGDRVPVALVGAQLPIGMKVERKTIRGEASEGMLCSPFELGLSEDHTGILIMPRGTELGKDVRDVLGLQETVLELDITPNRPDATSLIGVATEVAAKWGGDLLVPDSSISMGREEIGDLATVVVEDPARCPRYTARVITGVSIGPSPDLVQSRLSAAGIRPISNVVDATNYALIVMGHPMHAFDLTKVAGAGIVVRRANKRESLLTLDGEHRALDPDDLVIADANRAVGLAGVMGGEGSEITEATKDVLIESAYFDPKSIFRTSKRHDVRSESSARFERGADIGILDEASKYCARLIVEWSGGSIARGVIDTNPVVADPVTISLRPEKTNLLLGTQLTSAEMFVALDKLGLSPSTDDHTIIARVPSRRRDLAIEEDLIEEVARFVGYDHIPSQLPPGSNRAGALTHDQKVLRHLRRVLNGAGLWEAITTSFLGPDDFEKLGWSLEEIPIIENPISADASILRPSLIPGLLTTVARNVARRNLIVEVFETGRCFGPSKEILPEETVRLGIAMYGPYAHEWHSEEREIDFFDLKGVIETIVNSLHSGAHFEPYKQDWLHPGRSARVFVGDENAGFIGELSPIVAEKYDLPGRVLVGEVDVDMLISAQRAPITGFEVPRFPAVLLDLAVSLEEQVPVSDVLEVARRSGGELLESVKVFDVYRGEQVGPGRKSVALSFTFRHPERTLTEDEGKSVLESIAGSLERDLRGEIRR